MATYFGLINREFLLCEKSACIVSIENVGQFYVWLRLVLTDGPPVLRKQVRFVSICDLS